MRLNLFLKWTLLLNTLAWPCLQALNEDQHYWKKLMDDEINLSVNTKTIAGNAKNVILFLGDGMGVSTVTAARIFKGQKEKQRGEEGYLTFDRFPNLALLKTYNLDRQVADSAGTATAYLTGVKANFGTIGVDANVKFSNCTTYDSKHHVASFLIQAAAEGKSVGLVTTTRITHATPAGAYAYTPHRDWECDSDKKKLFDGIADHDRSACVDIAQQLINNAFPFHAILGGGRLKFIPESSTDPIKTKVKGERKDGRNLIEEWVQKHKARNHKATVAYTASQLREVDFDHTDYLLGLFSPSHMEYEEERVSKNADEPSLTEMTLAALKILKRNPKGFVMLVEGGRIDHGHHLSQARNALSETVAFDEAISAAVKNTAEKDTLIMVTADHSHTFTIGTYPSRGKDILGKTDFTGFDRSSLAGDSKPVTILMYANGPTGLKLGEQRTDESSNDTTVLNYRYQSLIPLSHETHGGEDVAVFARGPWAHLFQRVHEQTMVAQVARYAACLPPYEGRCSFAMGTYQHYHMGALMWSLISSYFISRLF